MFIWRLIKRLIKALVVIVVIVVLIPVAGLAYGFLSTDAVDTTPLARLDGGAAPEAIASKLRTEIDGYQRPEESTFLTYPEWAIVYAARDYAGFVKDHPPSGFPYWSYIGRYWQDYAMVIRASSAYPFNFQNHQMLVVIGTSHTIEHVIQWAYENSIGRVTEWTDSGGRTAADDYLATTATDYAAFLDQVPWYEFPYADKRAGLLAIVPAAGDDTVRTTERRWAFGFAWAIKQAYADLIKSALSATSAPALLDIHVWAKGPVSEVVRPEPDTLLERDFGADGTVFITKRYQVFTDMIPRLIAQGVSFVEIGGNDEILVTMLSGGELPAAEGSRVLFAYPIPADPTVRRTGLIVAVPRLHTVLPALMQAGGRLEHVYDY